MIWNKCTYIVNSSSLPHTCTHHSIGLSLSSSVSVLSIYLFNQHTVCLVMVPLISLIVYDDEICLVPSYTLPVSHGCYSPGSKAAPGLRSWLVTFVPLILMMKVWQYSRCLLLCLLYEGTMQPNLSCIRSNNRSSGKHML